MNPGPMVVLIDEDGIILDYEKCKYGIGRGVGPEAAERSLRNRLNKNKPWRGKIQYRAGVQFSGPCVGQ